MIPALLCTFLLLRVVDGDTLTCGADRIRVWGVDAPELPTSAGEEAKRRLAAFLYRRSIVCLDHGKDHYGRIVAQCFADGEDIANWLICHGLAKDWPAYSKGYYAKCRP